MMSMKKILNAWRALDAIEKAAVSVGVKPSELLDNLKDNALGKLMVAARDSTLCPEDLSEDNERMYQALVKLGVIQ